MPITKLHTFWNCQSMKTRVSKKWSIINRYMYIYIKQEIITCTTSSINSFKIAEFSASTCIAQKPLIPHNQLSLRVEKQMPYMYQRSRITLNQSIKLHLSIMVVIKATCRSLWVHVCALARLLPKKVFPEPFGLPTLKVSTM